LSQSLSQPSQRFHRLLDPFRPESRIKPETVPVLVPEGEDRSRSDADPFLHGCFVEFKGIKPFRHLHPEYISPFGTADPCSLREVADDRIPELGSLTGIGPAELAQMMIVAAVGEKLGYGELVRRSGGDVQE